MARRINGRLRRRPKLVNTILPTFFPQAIPRFLPHQRGNVLTVSPPLRFSPFIESRIFCPVRLTKPLRSHKGLLAPLEVVRVTETKDVKMTAILPIPPATKAWGESNLSDLENDKAVFEPEKGDVAGPLYGGAAAEKANGARLVVIASPTFAFDDLVKRLDPADLRRGISAARFPANGELFRNSIFWLAKMDPGQRSTTAKAPP